MKRTFVPPSGDPPSLQDLAQYLLDCAMNNASNAKWPFEQIVDPNPITMDDLKIPKNEEVK